MADRNFQEMFIVFNLLTTGLQTDKLLTKEKNIPCSEQNFPEEFFNKKESQ